MIFEVQKQKESTEEIIARRKKEIYETWSSKQMCLEELKRVEEDINRHIKACNPEDTRTANDIVDEMRSVFKSYRISFDGIASAVLIYLFEVLKL